MKIDLVDLFAVPERSGINKRLISIAGADMSHLGFIEKLYYPIIIHFQAFSSGLIDRFFIGVIRHLKDYSLY